MTNQDWMIIGAYIAFSQEEWASNFIYPTQKNVQQFRTWLAQNQLRPPKEREKALLEEYRRQEQSPLQ